MFLVEMVDRQTDKTMEEKIFGTKKKAKDFANLMKNGCIGFIITDMVTNIVEEYEV